MGGQNYNIKVYKSQFDVTNKDLGKVAFRKSWGGIVELKERLKPCSTKKSGYEETKTISLAPGIIEEMTKLYGEELVEKPIENLQYYFDLREGKKEAKRGVPVEYPDLYYQAKRDELEYTFAHLLGSVGEGIAGHLLRDLYGYEIVARPLGLPPDLIMSKGEGTLGLAEVTASATFTGLSNEMRSKATSMIDLVAHFRYLSDKKLEPYIVGTAFTDRHDFEAFILELLMPQPR